MTLRPVLFLAALAAACTPATDRAPVDTGRTAHPATVAAQPARPDSIAPGTGTASAEPYRGPTDVQAGPIPDTVRTACDTATALMRAALAIGATRVDGSYRDSSHGTARVGCRITGTGSFKALKSGGPVDLVADAFNHRGWRQHSSADGPDGAVIGMRRRDLLCTIIGSWDGGDDSEPDTAAAKPDADPAYEINIECARDVPSNADAGVPDSLWSVARQAGLDSAYMISPRMQYPPYTSADLDGDGVADAAVLVEHRRSGKLGIAIVRRGARTVAVLGAGSGSAGPDDLDGVQEWDVFPRQATMNLTIGYRPNGRLIADALWIDRGEKGGGFYLWTGSGFIFEPHSR